MAQVCGEGNRPTTLPAVSGTPTPYSTLFAELYAKYVGQAAKAQGGEAAPEVLMSGLAAMDVALMPVDPGAEEAAGVSAAKDGTAWIYSAGSGDYVVAAGGRAGKVHVAAGEMKRF